MSHARPAPPLFTLVALFLAVASFTPRQLLAQSSGSRAVLHGRVVDTGGAPVAGAQISLRDGSSRGRLGASAGDDGRYRIEGLTTGAYTVRVEAIGFAPARRENVALASGQVRTVDFTLEVAPVEMAAIRVEASRDRFQESYGRTASEVTVETETARDFNSANTYDALRIVPGVSFLWNAGNRHGKPSRIRGGSTWSIPDVIEDLPSVREAGIGAEDGGLTADFGSSIPALALEGIEVRKGSLGVLHGSDADGGVIVNQLKRGRAGAPDVSLWVEASGIGEQLYMADVGGGTGSFDYYAAGKLLDGRYEDFRDPQGRVLSREDFHSGLARLGWSPGADLRGELLSLYGRDRIRYTEPKRDDPETSVDESTELPPNRFRTTNRTSYHALTTEHAVSDALSYDVGYTLFHQRPVRFSLTENAAHRDRPETAHTLFGNAYLEGDLAPGVAYSAKTGVEWVEHTQEEDAGGSSKEQRFTDRSAFVAGAVDLGESVALNAGLRYLDAADDWQDHSALAWNLGTAATVLADTKLSASYSTGYSRNKGFAYFFGPIDEADGVDLSTNRTFEVGVEQPVPAIGDASGSVSVALFRTTNVRVPTFSGWGAGTVYYETREVRGLELFGRYPLLAELDLTGSFTWMETEVTETTHPEGVGVGSTGVQVPRYTAAFGADWTPTSSLRFSALAAYDDGMRRESVDVQTNEVVVTTNAAYTRLNLTGEYEVTGGATLRLRVENLLDETDLGYTTQTLTDDGWEVQETIAKDPGRFLSLAVILRP